MTDTTEPLAERANVLPFPADGLRDPEADPAARETELLVRLRDFRDEAAFAQLFACFAPKVQGYLQRTGLDPADAENVLQDIMIAVWNKAQQFDATRASARTWIFSMARNRLIDLKRAERREFVALERYVGETAGDAIYEEDLYARAAGQKSVALLSQLPEAQAHVLVMAYVEGKSHREIARELNLPIGTVKSRARLAFQRIRGIFEAAN